jgi:hypothetical protein
MAEPTSKQPTRSGKRLLLGSLAMLVVLITIAAATTPAKVDAPALTAVTASPSVTHPNGMEPYDQWAQKRTEQFAGADVTPAQMEQCNSWLAASKAAGQGYAGPMRAHWPEIRNCMIAVQEAQKAGR